MSDCVPSGAHGTLCLLPGMPDFLEKLHAATLKAKRMEIEVRDYISARPAESSGSESKASLPNAEHKPEGTRSPAQLGYA